MFIRGRLRVILQGRLNFTQTTQIGTILDIVLQRLCQSAQERERQTISRAGNQDGKQLGARPFKPFEEYVGDDPVISYVGIRAALTDLVDVARWISFRVSKDRLAFTL